MEAPVGVLSTRDAPTSAGLCAGRFGRYAHLCRYTWGGGGRRRHTPSADSHQHRVKVFLHREKSLAELNPPALFSPC